MQRRAFSVATPAIWNSLPLEIRLLLKSNTPFFYKLLKTDLFRNRKLEISRAPIKVKSRESAYSQALNQNKTDRQRSKSRESGRQTVKRLWWMVLGVETGRELWGRR